MDGVCSLYTHFAVGLMGKSGKTEEVNVGRAAMEIRKEYLEVERISDAQDGGIVLRASVHENEKEIWPWKKTHV